MYRGLYEGTPVMMHSIDTAGRITSVNEHWLEVMGYDRDEVIGRRSVEFVTEASRVYAIEIGMPAALSRGFARDVPYQMVKKDGEVIDVLISARHVGDGEDRLRLGFVVDVTERNRTEGMLIQQMQERAVLEERNRLAREIHDTLAQSLLGTVINLVLSQLLI